VLFNIVNPGAIMKRTSIIKRISARVAIGMAFGLAAHVALAQTDIASEPLTNAGAQLVKPNLMFILDTSGSMDRDHMPDSVDDDRACKANGSTLTDCNFSDPPYNSANFNGIYYDPTVTYTPAVNFDGTSRASYTTWTAVPNDAYGIQFTGTIDLTTAYPDTVWCNTSSPSDAQRTPPFTNTSVCRHPIQGGVWTYPNSTHNRRANVFGTARNPYYYTIGSVTWCSTANTAGFGTGTCQAKKTATYQYPKYGTGSDGITRVDIVPGTANYPRAVSRTDCSGTVGPTGCTYAQEMTNFANWYAYYRTRMQTMKTAAGLAFDKIDSSFRVGLINLYPGSPVSSNYFLPISDFTAGATGQKNKWYTLFYNQNPNNLTPLREALSRVGRYYANVTTGINQGMNDDPVQYSCQQNFALLSTDGLWNNEAGQKLDGSAIGHQDSNPATAPRPMLDGPLRTTVVTTTDTLTQQVCTGTQNAFGVAAGACGCAANYSRVKQQTSSSVNTVVSIDGVVQSTTPSTSTSYQDITACNALVTTTVTPTTITNEQTVVANGATSFTAVNSISAGMNTNGTCGANFAQVITRTANATSSVTTTGSSSAAPVLGATYSFSYGACVPLTTTVVTRFNVTQDQTLVAGASSSFGAVSGTPGAPSYGAAGGPQGTGTCLAHQARVWRRTSSYEQTATTIGSGATTYTFSAPAYNAPAPIGSCVGVTHLWSVTETAQNVCSANLNTTYAAAGNGNNSQVACGCAAGNTALRQRVWNYNRTLSNTGATSYSNGSPVLPSHTTPTYVIACSTAAKSVLLSPNPTVVTTLPSITGAPVAAAPSNTTTPVSTTVTGAPVAGAPITTPGTPTSTTTGANITSADFTISPNPRIMPPVSNSTSVAVGYADTLADVAQYYYITDLRGPGSLGAPVGTPATQQDVGTLNNVRAQPNTDVQNDSANWQHMTTFTLGLGVDGAMTYDPKYRTSPTGDFLAIKNGSLNWPQPVGNTVTTVDDLWHAAVNGRGKYFSAQDPSSLVSGLMEALTGMKARFGAASAAATSNLEPVDGDNFAYVASYQTSFWDGDLQARTIDLLTGAVSPTAAWKAQEKLDTQTYATTPGGTARKIYRFNPVATNALEDFTWANLSATSMATYFGEAWIGTGATALTQWGGLSATDKTAAAGANLVNYLRGDPTYEGQYYRDRVHVLGDMVNGAPVYVKTAQASYNDPGYGSPAGANFKTCVDVGGPSCSGIFNGPRGSTVYVAANDGMLHAFNGATGNERWAYIPNILMPKLFRLADESYASKHQYFVDGSPTVADFYDAASSKWKTILVGGLNSGGRGYYALDVTDPDNPKGLWEFNVRALGSCPGSTILGSDKDDCDLGLTYGNPIVTKLQDGTWVVIVTSGYNNFSPGDGKGYLYVLDPMTGVILKKIKAANAGQSLNPGDTTSPLGLARVNAWVDDGEVNNTALRIYGGDMHGYLWRFDLETGTAYAIARYTDPSGVAQPVTTKPELAEVNGVDMIYVGTGRYLGASDVSSSQVQSVYGIKDTTNGTAPTTYIDARGASLVSQTLANSTTTVGVRTVTDNAVDLTARNGWRVDLPQSGERVNVDIKLVLGTLIVASNVPSPTVCEPSGSSWLNFFNHETGGRVSSSNSFASVGMKGLIVGISIVVTTDGKIVGIVIKDDNTIDNTDPPVETPNPTGSRSSWRELQ
jgi:type IV pilus assembly protein PilY1